MLLSKLMTNIMGRLQTCTCVQVWNPLAKRQIFYINPFTFTVSFLLEMTPAAFIISQ